MPTKIEWTDETWNPVRGCRRKSAGCGGPNGEGGCYAERMAYRFSGPGQPYQGLVRLTKNGPRWTGATRNAPDSVLTKPLRWRKPRTVFVDSMADLFFDDRADADIDRGFAVMLICALRGDGHVFQILTKYAQRMLAWSRARDLADRLALAAGNLMEDGDGWHDRVWNHVREHGPAADGIWLMVSAEDQANADERIPLLLKTPATIRGVSYEPALGPIDFRRWIAGCGARYVARAAGITDEPSIPAHLRPAPSIDWIIFGAESGPGRRPADVSWFRDVVRQRDQVHAASGVALFFKQWVGELPDGLERSKPDESGDKVSLPRLDGRIWDEIPVVRVTQR